MAGSEGVFQRGSVLPTFPMAMFTTCLYMQEPLAYYSITKLREGEERQQFC